MTAGDQVRDAANKARLQARQHRDQAAKMHLTAIDLERLAGQLEVEASGLERQAKNSDESEKRAKLVMDKIKTNNL